MLFSNVSLFVFYALVASATAASVGKRGNGSSTGMCKPEEHQCCDEHTLIGTSGGLVEVGMGCTPMDVLNKKGMGQCKTISLCCKNDKEGPFLLFVPCFCCLVLTLSSPDFLFVDAKAVMNCHKMK
jgi:hypothetical protein